MSDGWIEFEDDTDGARMATYDDMDLGLTATQEREHHEYVQAVLAERGIDLPTWEPKL